MADISGLPPATPGMGISSVPQNEQELSKMLVHHIQKLKDSIQQVTENPALATDQSHMNAFSNTVLQLEQLSNQCNNL
jgi:hypothetical protein